MAQSGVRDLRSSLRKVRPTLRPDARQGAGTLAANTLAVAINSNSSLVALIVDDDPASARRAARAVAELGFTPVQHGSAEDALEWLASHPAPALCVIDLTLPRMSGFGLCARIREEPRTRAVRTVVTPGRKAMGLDDNARALELELVVVERPAELSRTAGDLFGVTPRASRWGVLAFLGA